MDYVNLLQYILAPIELASFFRKCMRTSIFTFALTGNFINNLRIWRFLAIYKQNNDFK